MSAIFAKYRAAAAGIAFAILLFAALWYRSHLINIGEQRCAEAQQEALNKALTKQAADAQMELKRRAEIERSSVAAIQATVDAKDSEIERLRSVKPETLVKTVTLHDSACPVVVLDPSFRGLYNNAGTGRY